MYRDIEYQYLELFRDCALSKQFLPIFHRFEDKLLFRPNKHCTEVPTKKDEVLDYLSDFFNGDVKYQGIKYIVEEEVYALYLLFDGVVYMIRIEVRNNLISTLWVTENINEELPHTKSEILNAIAQAWGRYHCMYIEDFLDRYFKFELYGNEEIFGHHVLSKRQFLIWFESRLEIIKSKPGVSFEIKATGNGIIMTLNGQSRFISMKFCDGKILEAKETDLLFYL